MLNEEELKLFLELLRVFGLATGLSNRAMASLFGVQHTTLSRWRRMTRDDQGRTTHRSQVEAVQDKIEYLNKVAAVTGLYAAIREEQPKARSEALRRELDKRGY